ncbi:MAG: urease accessory protein UreE [Thermaurantiacus tibetensis]|uniref:urease accessory protein UreE n=1 Tax=Thermaurantiacus tibetensis TaxID=2759035 RepID=UPI0018905FD0|nr:urease accessory protein UreE [Thermaurantiacus tibetensis]
MCEATEGQGAETGPVRVVAVRPPEEGPADDVLTLDFDRRSRRRHAFRTDGGTDILLDLPRPLPLVDGSRLVLADGRMVAVRAAAEPLLEVRAADACGLARLAWHIGNRHVPAEFRAEAFRIHADHVLEEMLRGLGARVERLVAPFQPEGGAYSGAHAHHGHAHHGHAHHGHGQHGHGRHDAADD